MKSIEPVQADVIDLSHDGRGVVKVDGKVYFVPGALPGERITFLPRKKRRRELTGELVTVDSASDDRVEPRCSYFGICGGCTLQHLSAPRQLELKQKVLLDALERIGRVSPDEIMPSLNGDYWGYRRKARPGCKYVAKKGGMLIGFREQASSFLTSLRSCETLDPRLSKLLSPLHETIGNLSCYNRIPQIEMAVADNGVALVVRHLVPLEQTDRTRLKEFAITHSVRILMQSGGPDTVEPLWPSEEEPLEYRLPKFDLAMSFSPLDFIQVNASVNDLMIDRAIDELNLDGANDVLDLFCGLGNFTLPIARSGAQVVGIEGDQSLVEKGRENAQRNRLDNVQFEAMNLHDDSVTSLARYQCDRMLLDPPRSGAIEVVTHLVPLLMPEIIVYVSCNPATLARDAGVLVNTHGYHLTRAGAVNMFPHTAHIESIATFVRSG